jgi:hypothetical protein
VVPAGSDRVSRVRPYSGTRQGRDQGFAYGTFALCGRPFQAFLLPRSFVTPPPSCRTVKPSPTTPTRLELHLITPGRFGLFPFRSPLLRESRFLSFRLGTKMYQFPSLSPPALCVQAGVRAHYRTWVPPFGNPRVEGCSAPHRGLSQPSTSFIDSWRQGIRQWLLLS